MYSPKPDWLKIRVHTKQDIAEVEKLLKNLSLHTVCEEANCPNLMECFNRKTATFMILGKTCTRNCTFCNVSKGKAESIDPEEPHHIALAVKQLNLRHVVVTSVTRDDLEDGGASHFVNVINAIKATDATVTIEVLIPDFKGDSAALSKVAHARPEIINHNIETVPRLYPMVRSMAIYRRSLDLLQNVKSLDNRILVKSGIIVGLGEQEDEVIRVFKDLINAGCDMLTVGQYLSPSSMHHPVVAYVHPEVFEKYKAIALELGFKHVESGPLVRSSYLAEKVFQS